MNVEEQSENDEWFGSEPEELQQLNDKLEEKIHKIMSQLKKANEELRESQELNRSIIQTAADAIISIDSDGFISLWNDAAEKIFGYTSSEIMNKRLTEIIPGQYRAAHRAGLQRLKKGGKERLLGKTIEIIGLRKDGRSLPIELSLSCRESDTHKYYTAIIRDISKRKKAERTLRENEKLLRTVAENYPNSYVSIIEEDFSIGFTSGQEFKKLDLDPEKFIGLQLEQVFGEKTAIVREHYENTFEGHEQAFEIMMNDQYQLYRTVPLYSENGSIHRILAVVENITERKKYEKNLEVTNKALVSFNKNLRVVKQKMERNNRELKERLKEINCLYQISQLTQKHDLTLDEIIQEVIKIIPPSWQYPDITGCRIIWDGEHHQSENFHETEWTQKANIIVHNKKRGSIEVCYITEKPIEFEGPFLKEERHLIDEVAKIIVVYSERKHIEQELQEHKNSLE